MEDSARFRFGEKVRVGGRTPSGHCRTPAYVRGKAGRVVGFHGRFLNPESLAYGGSGLPKQPLYQVEFEQGGVWDGYRGGPSDKLLVDIFQHWLETT